jgi:Protein of unknown function (DUF1353)
MNVAKFVLILFCMLNFKSIYAGVFTGDLKLVPDGCQNSPSQICKLEGMLRYESSNGSKLVWQTDAWSSDSVQSGTTNGASIPGWAQSIIGAPYDPSYLKAAIVHDHYCFKENYVRSWRDTHRMFYDALIDLNVPKLKAKLMYFAVYTFGPHWLDIEIVAGTNCGDKCVNDYKKQFPKGKRSESSEYERADLAEQINKLKTMIENNPNLSIDDIEDHAKTVKPNDFYLMNGSKYFTKGSKDPNLFITK